MSQPRYCTFLPQISAGSIPLCLLFSCPGDRILHFCHRFQPGASPCACFFHVPETEYCISATKKPRPRKSPRIPKAVALIIHYFGLTRPYQIPLLNIPNLTSAINFLYQASAISLPNHTFSGSGYSTPNVSTVTLFIFCSLTGLSFQSVSVSAILFTTSMPSITLPNAA